MSHTAQALARMHGNPLFQAGVDGACMHHHCFGTQLCCLACRQTMTAVVVAAHKEGHVGVPVKAT